MAVLATDAHDDHVRVSPELTKATGAAAAASEDLVLWRQTHGSWGPDEHLIDGQRIHVAGVVVHVLHTPGHAPGAVCFDVEDIRAGDPGARRNPNPRHLRGGGHRGRNHRSHRNFPPIRWFQLSADNG